MHKENQLVSRIQSDYFLNVTLSEDCTSQYERNTKRFLTFLSAVLVKVCSLWALLFLRLFHGEPPALLRQTVTSAKHCDFRGETWQEAPNYLNRSCFNLKSWWNHHKVKFIFVRSLAVSACGGWVAGPETLSLHYTGWQTIHWIILQYT